MTTILSAPTVVTINAPGTSALSILARSMSAGTWAELTGVVNQFGSLGNTSGNSGHIIGYGNSAAWDPISNKIHIVGNDHGASSISHAIYDDATNSWANRVNAPMTVGHAYDRTIVNPTTGDVFHKDHTGSGTGVSVYRVWRKTTAGSWTLMSGLPTSNAAYLAEPGCAMVWWSRTMTGIGAQGCLALANESGNGEIMLYDPIANAWSRISGTGGAFDSDYHGVFEYSPVKNCAIYGGANAQSTTVRRLNSDRSFTTLTSFSPGWGVLRGNCAADPVTGNFLILKSSGFYEYNPSGSGSFAQQTGSKAPPGGIGAANFDPGNVMSCPIPEYGVICYITAAASAGGCHMHLYKHA